MKLYVNGCSGGYPSSERACSSYLLEVAGKKIVLDMGPGSLVNLQKHIDIEDIDLIVISHWHYDHISDLYSMGYSFDMRKKTGITVKPIKVIAEFDGNYDSCIRDNSRFEAINLTENLIWDWEGIHFEFFVTSHPVKCFAVRISYENKIFVYSGDMSSNTPNMYKIFGNADLAVMDCGELDYYSNTKSSKAHLTPVECYRTAKENNVKRTILSHIIPHYSIEKYNAELFNLKDWNYIIAEDNSIEEF